MPGNPSSPARVLAQSFRRDVPPDADGTELATLPGRSTLPIAQRRWPHPPVTHSERKLRAGATPPPSQPDHPPWPAIRQAAATRTQVKSGSRPQPGFRVGSGIIQIVEMRRPGLLSEIEQDVVNDNVPTATLLRKCIVLGGRVGSTELRDWARRELRGYEATDDLPNYRKTRALICVDAIVGNNAITAQSIGSEQLPSVVREAGIDEQVLLRMGIGELEDLARRDEKSVKLTLPRASLIMRMMNFEAGNPFQQIHSIYWNISVSTIRGVVENVRTALAELVGELLQSGPDVSRNLSKEAADQAVNLMISGKRNTVHVTTAQSTTGGESSAELVRTPSSSEMPEHWWHRWRKRGLIIGFSTFVAAVAAVGTWLGWTPWR